MDYPTHDSVDLGLKMIAITGGADLEERLAEFQRDELPLQKLVFQDHPQFVAMAEGLHRGMAHAPIAHMPEVGCVFQTKFLLGVMAKMFYAGWSAGRQEVMDLTFEKATKEAEGQG